jgi:hypothetical protein
MHVCRLSVLEHRIQGFAHSFVDVFFQYIFVSEKSWRTCGKSSTSQSLTNSSRDFVIVPAISDLLIISFAKLLAGSTHDSNLPKFPTSVPISTAGLGPSLMALYTST